MHAGPFTHCKHNHRYLFYKAGNYFKRMPINLIDKFLAISIEFHREIDDTFIIN